MRSEKLAFDFDRSVFPIYIHPIQSQKLHLTHASYHILMIL